MGLVLAGRIVARPQLAHPLVLNGTYCDKGNVCVKLFDTGKIVCCTDLKCTAAVVSGTTTFLSQTGRATPAAPSVTQPPVVTQPPATTQVIVNQYSTWYWTVTWWYYSFYYTPIRAASTVTYTTVYFATTYTTTALNSADASSRFAALSATLSFAPPPSATALASLVGAIPSQTPSLQAGFGTTKGLVQSVPNPAPSTSAFANIPSAAATSARTGGGGASSASNMVVGWILLGSATLSGMLLILL